MRINFYSSFRENAGVKSIDLPLVGVTTVMDIISSILRQYPGLKRLWLDENEELHGHVHISVNKVDVLALPDQLGTVVGEKDELDFYPPITGG